MVMLMHLLVALIAIATGVCFVLLTSLLFLHFFILRCSCTSHQFTISFLQRPMHRAYAFVRRHVQQPN